MDILGGIFFIIIIVAIIYAIYYFTSKTKKITDVSSAKSVQQIQPTTLSSPDSTNFAYSIWIYVDDWNYKYGEPKVILARMTSETTDEQPCPSISLDSVANNLNVSMTVYPSLNTSSDDSKNFMVHSCSVSDIPLQKWVNIIVSIYNRTMDIYIDGKLRRTCLMPGVSKIDSNASVYITPLGGFSGWTSNFQTWSEAIDPQTAWNTYSNGYSSNLFGSYFGKYSVKLSVTENGTEDASITL